MSVEKRLMELDSMLAKNKLYILGKIVDLENLVENQVSIDEANDACQIEVEADKDGYCVSLREVDIVNTASNFYDLDGRMINNMPTINELGLYTLELVYMKERKMRRMNFKLWVIPKV